MHTLWRTTSGLQGMALFLMLAVGFGSALVTGAQEQRASEPYADELKRDVPRTAMRGYLEAGRAGNYALAAAYLDLREVPPATRGQRGPVLARQLKAVLDRTLWVDLDSLSEAPEGDREDGLPAKRDLVGTVETAKGPVPVYLDRVRREDGRPIWKIASATVSRVPVLYAEFGYGPLAEYLPAVFFDVRFLEVQLWQWIGLLAVVATAVALSWLATAVIGQLGPAARSATGPLRLLIAVSLFAAGTYTLELAVPVQAFFAGLQKALAVVAVTWLIVRAIDVAARAMETRLIAREQASAVSIVALGRRTMKVLASGLAGLAILQNLGIDVTGVLAGLGIGGLAVALAAQKTVENLFGGVTLIADQPVRVGDFCRFGDKIGTVEEVGLRSTRVRTLDRTVVSIPNAAFSAMQLENYSKRDRMWFRHRIGLRYETTPDQLRYVLVELKKLLTAHPKVHPDPARPRFVGLGACSLDIEIFAYVATNDYDEFLAVQEDLLLRIMDLVRASGTGFAFPSQTIYAGADAGLDPEATRRAEEQVREWRAANALGLPYFRAEQLAAWRGVLDYPPKGSAIHA